MNRIYVAFPGVGKTKYTKMCNSDINRYCNGCLDLDIKAPDTAKARKMQKDMRNALSDYVAAAVKHHYSVCTHVWCIDPNRKYSVPIIVVVPQFCVGKEWHDRLVARDGICPFTEDLRRNWHSWILGWYEFAELLTQSGNDVHLYAIDDTVYLADLVAELDTSDLKIKSSDQCKLSCSDVTQNRKS